MAVILRQRRDTEQNWTSANPIIPDGQLCFDITNNTFRVGDGSTVYLSLPIQSGPPGLNGTGLGIYYLPIIFLKLSLMEISQLRDLI